MKFCLEMESIASARISLRGVTTLCKNGLMTIRIVDGVTSILSRLCKVRSIVGRRHKLPSCKRVCQTGAMRTRERSSASQQLLSFQKGRERGKTDCSLRYRPRHFFPPLSASHSRFFSQLLSSLEARHTPFSSGTR